MKLYIFNFVPRIDREPLTTETLLIDITAPSRFSSVNIPEIVITSAVKFKAPSQSYTVSGYDIISWAPWQYG